MTLRAITVAPREVALAQPMPTTADLGLDLIAIDALVIDDSYQRPLGPHNWKQIEAIARNFTWAHFTPCLIAPVGDGRFAVIDGQHRIHAAQLAGHRYVPAMIVSLAPEAQALAFGAVNGRITAVTALNVYRAALAAGETWALTCRDAVAAGGAELVDRTLPERRPAYKMSCVALIRESIKRHGPDQVTAAVAGLVQAVCGAKPWFWTDKALRGVIGLAAAKKASAAQMTAFLDAVDMERLAMGTDRLRAEGGEYAGRPFPKLFSEVLSQAWDRHFGGGK